MPITWSDPHRPPSGSRVGLFRRLPCGGRTWPLVWRLHKPTRSAALGSALTVLLLVGLGLWQMIRHAETLAVLAHIEHQITAPAVTLPSEINDPAAFDYRHVTVTGHLLNERELYLNARSRYGNPGLEVLTPLVREDGGGIVLINRGWIPIERRSPGTRSRGQPWNKITIDGVARRPPEPGWFPQDNHPERNDWRFIDPPAMAAAAGVAATPAPMIVEAGPSYNQGGLPVGGQTVIPVAGTSVWYALLCFGLAALVILVYIVAHWQRTPAK